MSRTAFRVARIAVGPVQTANRVTRTVADITGTTLKVTETAADAAGTAAGDYCWVRSSSTACRSAAKSCWVTCRQPPGPHPCSHG
jgi:sugar (pentulose or hexulose) kinase